MRSKVARFLGFIVEKFIYEVYTHKKEYKSIIMVIMSGFIVYYEV